MRVALALACVAPAAAGNLTSPDGCPSPDPAHCSANCDWTNHGKNCGRDVSPSPVLPPPPRGRE